MKLSLDRRSDGDMFMQKSGSLPNRNFGGNRSFGSNDGFSNQNNQSGNFYEDFDLNEFAKNINTLDRLVNSSRGNFNSMQNFGTNPANDNFGNSNRMRNPNNSFNSRGGNTNMNSFGGGSNNRNTNNERNFSNQDDGRSGQHCIHMRGLPYYSDEMDVFNVSSVLILLNFRQNSKSKI